MPSPSCYSFLSKSIFPSQLKVPQEAQVPVLKQQIEVVETGSENMFLQEEYVGAQLSLCVRVNDCSEKLIRT